MFFFSNFLKICDEEALWKVFRRWGSVCEVFITRRRSKVGQCYGFFRFHKVENVEHLAYQLDKIIVGCIKMICLLFLKLWCETVRRNIH